MAIATPLSVSGRWITDAHHNRVKLAGVNWAGAHQDAMTPGGLDLRHRDETAEAHREAFAFQDGQGHLQTSYRRRRLGKIPCGRISRKPMTVTPKNRIR